MRKLYNQQIPYTLNSDVNPPAEFFHHNGFKLKLYKIHFSVFM